MVFMILENAKKLNKKPDSAIIPFSGIGQCFINMNVKFKNDAFPRHLMSNTPIYTSLMEHILAHLGAPAK